VVKLLRTDTTLDLSQKARVVNCSERRSASYIGWLIRARAIAWSGYSELMSWSRNLKVMTDFVPDFVPSTGLWCPPHTKTWILVFQFLIYMKRPVTRKRISPETQNQKNGMTWFKRNSPYGTLQRIIHLPHGTHSHIHLRCMWTTSESSTPRMGDVRRYFLAFTVDFVSIVWGIPISALILHYYQLLLPRERVPSRTTYTYGRSTSVGFESHDNAYPSCRGVRAS